MGFYRKKPVVIEAMLFNGDTLQSVIELVGKNISGAGYDSANRVYAIISTMEGDHKCDDGDYVIRGVRGEFYPCKPDIFKLTYEVVKE